MMSGHSVVVQLHTRNLFRGREEEERWLRVPGVQIHSSESEADCVQVTASFIELYNEDFNDLLDPGFQDKSKTIQLREDPNSE